MEVAAALCSLSSTPALTHFPFSNSSSSKSYYPTIPSLLRPFSSSISASTPSSAAISPPSSKKILIPIGFDTEEMEAVVMIDVPRRAGAEVTVASVEPQLQVEASGGVRIVADTCISKCLNEVFDLVALPGGMPGSARLRDCEILRQITSRQADGKKLYGVICDVPAVTLLPWGLLKRKQVLIPIAKGSEAIEVVTIADVLRHAKMDVILASVGKSRQILASRDTWIIADKLISDAAEATYDLIILRGGKAGAESLYRSRTLKRLLKEQNLSGRICGAICPCPADFRRNGLPKGVCVCV